MGIGFCYFAAYLLCYIFTLLRIYNLHRAEGAFWRRDSAAAAGDCTMPQRFGFRKSRNHKVFQKPIQSTPDSQLASPTVHGASSFPDTSQRATHILTFRNFGSDLKVPTHNR